MREVAGATSAEAVAPAVVRIGIRLQMGLVRWIGAQGYQALLARAVNEECATHPVLLELNFGESDGPEVAAAVAEAVASHGPAEVGMAVESLIASMMDLLVRVVGRR